MLKSALEIDRNLDASPNDGKKFAYAGIFRFIAHRSDDHSTGYGLTYSICNSRTHTRMHTWLKQIQAHNTCSRWVPLLFRFFSLLKEERQKENGWLCLQMCTVEIDSNSRISNEKKGQKN